MFWRGENQMIFTFFVTKNLLRYFPNKGTDKNHWMCISYFPVFFVH